MRYLITGGSGYIGTRLVELLARRDDTEKIVIADVVPPRGGYRPKTEYERVDVRDRGAVHSALKRANPDVLVHLAFILNPVHDEGFMYDVDVNGTHNVLEAAAEAGIGQVLVTTSGVAYGAFPDNPEPITEDQPVRGVARFSYARDKTESDRIVQLWALQHPDVVTTIVRPCIVFGPNVDNYLVRLWTKQPITVDVGNLDGTIQFVHEDDVVDAISRLLLGRHAGQFNLVARGADDAARVRGGCSRRRCGRCRSGCTRAIAKLNWRLRLSEAPPGQLDFALLPVDRVEREGEEDARLDAALHARARRSRSRCGRRASCRRRSRPLRHRRRRPTVGHAGGLERLSPVAVDLDRREPAASHCPDMGGLLDRAEAAVLALGDNPDQDDHALSRVDEALGLEAPGGPRVAEQRDQAHHAACGLRRPARPPG